MHSGSLQTRHGSWLLGLVLVVAIALAPAAPGVRAEGAELGDGMFEAQAVPPAAEIERWWGAAGAILCAVEVRLVRSVPAIGLNPYALAAGLGGCVLAVMDIISSD